MKEDDTGKKQTRGREAELLLLRIIVTADVVARDSEEDDQNSRMDCKNEDSRDERINKG